MNEPTATARIENTPRKSASPQEFTVVGKAMISPHLLRVTLGGAGMVALRSDSEGGYFKLRFAGEGAKPPIRSYTIRRQREESVDVDFVLHGEDGHSGPAATWAMMAEIGDTIVAGGPGPAKPLPPGMARYVVAGDQTALPAIAVNLERLGPDARGVAVIEVPSEEDIQPLDRPAGVDIHWLINPEPGTRPELLATALRDCGWEDCETYGWAAAEFGSMVALRAYLRGERGLDRDHLYVSSYWKHGDDDDGHRSVKKADAALAG